MAAQQPQRSMGRFIVNGLAVIGALSIIFYVLLGIVLFQPILESYAQSPESQVGLHVVAKPWNDGKVILWHELSDGLDTPYSLIPDGSYCTMVTNSRYGHGSGEGILYYFHVLCDGTFGYVAVDQVQR